MAPVADWLTPGQQARPRRDRRRCGRGSTRGSAASRAGSPTSPAPRDVDARIGAAVGDGGGAGSRPRSTALQTERRRGSTARTPRQRLARARVGAAGPGGRARGAEGAALRRGRGHRPAQRARRCRRSTSIAAELDGLRAEMGDAAGQGRGLGGAARRGRGQRRPADRDGADQGRRDRRRRPTPRSAPPTTAADVGADPRGDRQRPAVRRSRSTQLAGRLGVAGARGPGRGGCGRGRDDGRSSATAIPTPRTPRSGPASWPSAGDGVLRAVARLPRRRRWQAGR